MADVIREDRLSVDRGEEPADSPRLLELGERCVAARAVQEPMGEGAVVDAVADAAGGGQELGEHRGVDGVVNHTVTVLLEVRPHGGCGEGLLLLQLQRRCRRDDARRGCLRVHGAEVLVDRREARRADLHLGGFVSNTRNEQGLSAGRCGPHRVQRWESE